MRIVCKDVQAETVYDVLHDTSYRKKWDTNMIDTYDIGRLTVNSDVGYYSCKTINYNICIAHFVFDYFLNLIIYGITYFWLFECIYLSYVLPIWLNNL